MTKKIWGTRMFEIAESRGLSPDAIAAKGNNLYKANYLYKIKAGTRAVPDSLSFQEWVAVVLDVPRDKIFFELPCTDGRNSDTSVQLAS